MASSVSGEQQSVYAVSNGHEDDLYTQLWLACAGSNVYIPRPGDKVYYFPQGHIGQSNVGNAAMPHPSRILCDVVNVWLESNVSNAAMPHPSRILCDAVNVWLKAEVHTDEVFAQITLLPVAEQDQLSLEDENVPSLPHLTRPYFSKTLTPSDTRTYSGLSVPKRYAEEWFPPLMLLQEMSLQPLVQQELTAKDLHGVEWHFLHIFRGQPRRHLLTSGWSTFVTTKQLVPGDSCIFVKGGNGELRLGIRRASITPGYTTSSASLISGDSTQQDILSSAFHTLSIGTMFRVHAARHP